MGSVIDETFTVGYVDSCNPGVFRDLIRKSVTKQLDKGDKIYIVGLTSGRFAVGACAFEREKQHLNIVSLYVDPEFRGKGGARLLLYALESIAAGLGFWLSASFLAVDEETKLLEGLFHKAGFELRKDVDYKTYIVTLSECEDADRLRNAKPDPKIKHFHELTDAKLKSYNKQAVSKNANIPEGGLTDEALDRELSVLYEESGRVKGFVAIENIVYRQGIRIEAAYNGSDNPLILMWLLKAALSAALEKYDESTPLVIDVSDDAADRFVRYILPEVEVVSRTYDRIPEKL